jgi:hypothetical protein
MDNFENYPALDQRRTLFIGNLAEFSGSGEKIINELLRLSTTISKKIIGLYLNTPIFAILTLNYTACRNTSESFLHYYSGVPLE